MLINWLKSSNYLIIGFLILIGSGGCEDYSEGCMDMAAVNFKASHQKPCCCEYPVLILQATLTQNEGSVSFTDTLTNLKGQKYLIRDLRFIFSGVWLEDSVGQRYHPIDTFGTHPIAPDIIPVNVKNLNNKGGEFMANQTFHSIDFSLKTIDELKDRRPAHFPSEHVLRDSSYYDFKNEQWIIAQVNLGLEDGTQKSIKVFGSDIDIHSSIENQWSKSLGQDLTVHFKINVDELFGDMDFNSTDNELEQLFHARLAGAFEP